MQSRPAPHTLASAVCACLVPAWLAAAGSPASAAEPAAVGADPGTAVQLPAVTVSASPLAPSSEDMSTPVSVLEDEALSGRREATLGETLAGQPGIATSHFGAGASRPVIRGLDAARVKILADGAEVQDASTISPDHAVALDPMLARQIEILRGPSALLYGGGAIGGVVNVLDRRIPTAIPEKGYEGHIELRAGSAAREGAAAFDITGAAGSVVLHAEGVKRRTSDYRAGSGWPDGRVEGSYTRGETGSIGGSWIGERGFFGLAFTRQNSRYGLPGHDHSYEGCHTHGASLHCPEDEDHDHDDDDHDHEDDHDDHDHADHDDHDDHADEHAHAVPYIKLRSERWDVRGEYREPFAGFARLRLRAGFTDYRHDEIEEDTIATTFRNKAHDARIELEHHPLGGLRGVIGTQLTRRDFSAIGEEAYLQPTETRSHAVFALEEYRLGDWRFEAGLRREWQRIAIESDAPNTKHRGTSASLGAVWRFAPQYSLGLSLSRSQRLPSAEELYAEGLHLATLTYERGDSELRAETSRNIDVSLRKHAGATTFAVSAFHNRIDDYIYARTLDVHEDLRLIQYSQSDATLSGLEGELRHRFSNRLAVTVFGDYVRGRLDGGDGNRNLPRIPSLRAGVRIDTQWQRHAAQLEWYRVGKQRDIADFETVTPGYGMINLRWSYDGRFGKTPYQLYARINNLTNRLAFNHASFIKDAAPLLGRNLMIGVRVSI